jgi:hypothetical protein
MAASVAEHFADVIVYWLPSGDYKAKLLNSGRQKPWCEMGGPDGDVIFQRWKEHQLFCIWLCKQHALEHGFVW